MQIEHEGVEYDVQFYRVNPGAWLVATCLLYGVFILFMNGLYWLLDSVGVFGAIFKWWN